MIISFSVMHNRPQLTSEEIGKYITLAELMYLRKTRFIFWVGAFLCISLAVIGSVFNLEYTNILVMVTFLLLFGGGLILRWYVKSGALRRNLEFKMGKNESH